MKLLSKIAIILLPLAASFCGAAFAADSSGCANIATNSGPVTGADNMGVCEFKGVPFAAPPVGELRFRPPQPPKPWTEPLVADAFGPHCYQTPIADISGKGNDIGSEDCLYLNVWARRDEGAKKPVMMFIHGGGFKHGSADTDTYDGARLAATGGAVVVTINYRLSAFGFFMHPALAEPDGSNEGNYGIYDQIAALKWIQANIANFGGDPANVTVFGESAGGMSVGALLASPLAEGLFQKAVIQSGPAMFMNKTIEWSMPRGEDLARAAGCDDPAAAAQCLRGLSSADVLHKLKTALMFFEEDGDSKKFPAEPLAGGKLLPKPAFELLAKGEYRKDIPVMIGSNKDEYSFFAVKEKIGTVADFENKIGSETKKLGSAAAEAVEKSGFMKLYDPAAYEEPKDAFTDLMTDLAFTCSTRALANALAGNGTSVYLYHFAWEPKGVQLIGDLGAFHGSELPFVFGNMTFMGIRFPATENKQVSKKIRAYWSGFAAGDKPAAEGQPDWPLYDADKQGYMELAFDPTPGAGFKKERCEKFDELMSVLMR